ncbi:MAG: 2-succinylbenzoate--CoA ligase [Microcystaceae cyanobacterium]
MQTPLFYLKKYRHQQELYQDLWQNASEFYQRFSAIPSQRILLIASDSISFLAYFVAIASTRHQLFLGNPNWKASEWEQVLNLVNPHQILNYDAPIDYQLKVNSSETKDPLIMIPTGGTSGKIRFVMHNWQTLTASAQGFTDYFNLSQVNSCCVLPLYHVGGLMQFVRSLITGGQFQLVSYTDLKLNKYPSFNPKDYFISLVPTQLQYLLNQPQSKDWLSKFKTILLGGAPAWDDLLEQGRQAQLNLSPTYGMTETASQIATLKPQDFLQGMSNCGQILPHAQVKITTDQSIAIQASSLGLGYYPNDLFSSSFWKTEDLGNLNEQGYLTIIGRKNQIIISGGEKIIPSEIEGIIRETKLVQDIVIIGVSDNYWGEKVVAVYVPKSENITNEQIKNVLSSKLANYKQPKEWITVEKLPRNAQGKINYRVLDGMIKSVNHKNVKM